MKNIWLIWLAVMWANLARNIASKGHSIVVYNRSYDKTQEFINSYGTDLLTWAKTLEEFVQSIQKPRNIIIMVQAWAPVDDVINQLLPLLDKWDTIVDCWNSFYKDTIERTKRLDLLGINFVGCWVSWWEEWALHGPSIMPWGTKESRLGLKDILESISARDFSWGPCVTHIWADWAWHYVKMVHNGIEYAIMQMIAETAFAFKKLYQLESWEISKIFENYNKWKLRSYLIEIMSYVLAKKDEFHPQEYLVDYILDIAWEKGTGRWTVLDAIHRWIPVPSIAQALFARSLSGLKDLRIELDAMYQKNLIEESEGSLSIEEFTNLMEEALYVWIISAYAQWYNLIQAAASEQNWEINLSQISRIWEWGCIIKADLLNFFREAYKQAGSWKTNLLEIAEVKSAVEEWLPSYQLVIGYLNSVGVSTACLSAGLHFILSITDASGTANYIQWLRDYFGAHTYQRTDRDWTFHTKR